MTHEIETFTKYENARILGARALQIAMDAPILLKISEEKLKEIRYDPLKIAELEFGSGVLPISIHRPIPTKRAEKLKAIREEKVEDEKLIEKEAQEEKDIVEHAEEMGLVQEDEVEDHGITTPETGAEEQ